MDKISHNDYEQLSKNDIVRDRVGEFYRREFEIDRGSWSIHLYWQDYRIGRLYGVEGEAGTIHLNEVWLNDAQRLRRSTLQRWAQTLLHRPEPTRNFRRLKLGAHLLPFFIEHTQRAGFRRIVGNLTQSDLEQSPFLPVWYEAHGFTVTLRPVGRWAGEIVLGLQSQCR